MANKFRVVQHATQDRMWIRVIDIRTKHFAQLNIRRQGNELIHSVIHHESMLPIAKQMVKHYENHIGNLQRLFDMLNKLYSGIKAW